MTYSLTDGSLVVGDAITGALTRTPGEGHGTYLILRGSLVSSVNYTLTVIDRPANGSSSNAAITLAIDVSATANHNQSEAIGQPSGSTQVASQPSSGGQGAAQLGGSGERSGAPYADNRWVSDNLRFAKGGTRRCPL